MERFFSSNSTGHLRSDAHQIQIIGRDADVHHTQIIEKIQWNYGGYIPPIGFRHPCLAMCHMANTALVIALSS